MQFWIATILELESNILTILDCDDLESNSFGNSNLRLCDLLPRPVPGREAALHHGGFACRWPQRASTGGIPRVVPEIRPMGTADQAWHLDPPTDGGLFQALSSVVSAMSS